MKLDTLLIWPPFDFPDGFYSNLRAYDPPLGLLALGAYVRQFDYNVSILDCNLRFENADIEFEDYLKEEILPLSQGLKVIGFTTTTPSVNSCYRLAKICKKILPDVQVVFGGAHASFVPDEALNTGYVDIVVVGEGEITFKEILDQNDLSTIKGIVYRDGSKFIRTPVRERIKDLDSLPIPAYDLIDMDKYRPILGAYKRLPAMMMVSSRGCPWSCNFCRRPVGKMLTVRSAQKIYDEMKMLSEVYGIKDIAFQDDVFTVNHENVFELCELLIKNPIDIRWLCFARVDIVSFDLLKKMQQAGCWQIMFGVENFEQSILDGINKAVKREQIFQSIEWAQKAGIEVRICMMVGNIGDTEEIINRNIRLIKQLGPDYLSVAIVTPFPGHDIYNWAVKENRISTYDWDKYYGATPILQLDTLTPEEITSLYRKMTFSVYFSPKFILKKLISIRTITELQNYTKGFLGLLHFYLEKIIFSLLPNRQVDRTLVKKEKKNRELSEDEVKKKIELTSNYTRQTART